MLDRTLNAEVLNLTCCYFSDVTGELSCVLQMLPWNGWKNMLVARLKEMTNSLILLNVIAAVDRIDSVIENTIANFFTIGYNSLKCHT